MVPLHLFPEVHPREDHEDAQCDHLLNDFQLECREFAIADPVCGNLKAILEEGNQPAHDNCEEERGLAILQMTIPGDSHEYVGENKQQYGFHSAESYHSLEAGLRFEKLRGRLGKSCCRSNSFITKTTTCILARTSSRRRNIASFTTDCSQTVSPRRTIFSFPSRRPTKTCCAFIRRTTFTN